MKLKKSYIPAILMVTPALLMYLLFQIWPLFGSIYYSFTNWNGLAQTYDLIGFNNYITLLHDEAVLTPLKNTFVYAFWTMLLMNVFALAFAIGLDRNIKGKDFLRACMFLPTMLSSLIVGYLFSFIIGTPLAALGKIMGNEVIANNMLGSTQWSLTCAIIAATWKMVGWYMVIYLAGLQNISQDLYEAADIDGVTPWAKFKNITFPLIAPAFTINMVLTVERAFKEYDMVFALTNGGPGNSSELLALTIYRESFRNQRGGYGSAVGIILFLIIVLLTYIQMHWLRRREDNAIS